MLCCAAVFIAAGQTYQISRHCLQHFSNYFHFSFFLLILKGLSHEIFLALPAIGGENREQSVNLRDDRQRISEESKRESREESSRESVSGKVSQKPIYHLNK
jgi:hypothetical protein